jgi:ankyrin repeat protein
MDDDLFYAARTGDAARVAYLLEARGAEADAHDDWQATPLFYAALCGHTDVMRLLLRAGAKCEVRLRAAWLMLRALRHGSLTPQHLCSASRMTASAACTRR